MKKKPINPAQVEKFLKENDISYKYVEHKYYRNRTTKIQIICTSIHCFSISQIYKEYDSISIYPFTQHHLSIEIDINND